MMHERLAYWILRLGLRMVNRHMDQHDMLKTESYGYPIYCAIGSSPAIVPEANASQYRDMNGN